MVNDFREAHYMSYVSEQIDRGLAHLKEVVKGTWDVARSFSEYLVTWDFDDIVETLQTLFRDVLAPTLKPVFDILGFEDEVVYSQEIVTTSLINKEAKYLQTHIINSVLGDTTFADDMLYAIHTSQKQTIRSFFNYGQNHYSKGVPIVTLSEYFTDTEVLIDVIETEEGEDITLSNALFSVPNADLWAKDYLIDNYSYVVSTNILIEGTEGWYFVSATLNGGETAFIITITRDVNTNVVVDDYTQVLLDPTEFTDTWTRTTTTVTYTPSGAPDVTIVDGTVTRTPTSTGGPYETTFVNVSDDDTPSTDIDVLGEEVPIYNEGGYYSAVYVLDSAPTITKIWFYEVALGTHPELNNELIGGDNDGMQTLPIIELRRDFINIDSDVTSDDYATTVRILDILDIVSLDAILTSITDNPDIDLIQDAFILFGANIYSDDQRTLKYVYGFFFIISSLPKFSKTEFEALTEADKSASTFVYAITQGAYNVTITGNYIEITEFTGYIGNVGFSETEFTILANTEAAVEDLDDRTDPVTSDPDDSLGLVNSIFTIRTQLTEDTYSEIEVSGLVVTTLIVTTGVDVGIKIIELVDPDSTEEADVAARSNFILPLSYYVIRNMPFRDCEQLIYDSCSLVIYAEASTELDYYETEAFLELVSVIIEIVAIVILVLSLGQAAGVSEALWILAKQLLIQFALTFALKELLSHNLSDTEKAVVLLAYLYASKKGADFSGTDLTLLADEMLLLVDSVITFFEIDLNNKTQDLLEEQAELQTLQTAREAEIAAAEEYLSPEGVIDTFDLLNGRTIARLDTDITPTNFYIQSLLVNMAPIIYSQTSTYVSSVLDLDNINSDFKSYGSTDFNLLTEVT